MKVWIDGRIVDETEARIPVTDHGLLYGDGVFEGIRIYAGRLFRLEDHLRRLEASARAIGLAIPGGTDRARNIIVETARAVGADEGYVRLLVTRGEGPLGVDPGTCGEPRIICLVDDVDLFPSEKAESGIALATVSVRRPDPDVLDPRVKSLNYLNNVLAKLEAKQRNADDGLILNRRGLVAEASAANVFAVIDGAVLTPPVSDGALEGITRKTVIELAAALGLSVRVESLGRFDVLRASEVFLTGTGARIVPVRSLDGQPVGTRTPGEVTAALRQAFLDYVRSDRAPGVPVRNGAAPVVTGAVLARPGLR